MEPRTLRLKIDPSISWRRRRSVVQGMRSTAIRYSRKALQNGALMKLACIALLKTGGHRCCTIE